MLNSFISYFASNQGENITNINTNQMSTDDQKNAFKVQKTLTTTTISKKAGNTSQGQNDMDDDVGKLLSDGSDEPVQIKSLLNSNKSISMLKEQSDLLAKGVILSNKTSQKSKLDYY